MHWFLNPIKNQYADFEGRATRQEFWMYILIYFLLYIAAGIVGMVIGVETGLALLFSLVLLVPSLAITARRLHDTGLSGWWQLIGVIPFIGLIVMIVLTVRDSESGANQYGANPKGDSGVPDTVAASDSDATM